jgi:heme/copper-type cytochrome/quinol oxidase subunit 2
MKTTYIVIVVILIAIIGVVAYILLGGGFLSLSATGGTCTPNVSYTLVAYQNQYFFQNDTDYKHPNPTLYAKVGDCIKVTIIDNEDVIHNFIVNQLNVQSNDITSKGQSQTVIFKVNQAGTFKWTCSYHADTMNGQLVVQP